MIWRRLAGAALAAALSVPRAAPAEPAFFPISPCPLVDLDDTPLPVGEPRIVPIAADSCPVPADASAVLVEVTAGGADAPARLALLPGGFEQVAPATFAVGAGGGRGSVVVPLDFNQLGALGLRADRATAGAGPAVAVTLVGYFAEPSTFPGTTGFIQTRPTCVPPKYTPDPLNYLQGPEPLQLPNGDVTLLVGAGRCCTGHWEGLFSLNYPAAGRAATPRFSGIWATNDFGRTPSRKEAEIGFPSALLHGGKWRIALTTTFRPFHRPNRDRVGRIDLDNLSTRATPAQVKNLWVPPISAACRQIASCPGNGSGMDVVLTRHPNGDLYLYHRDGNYPACSSGYVRHRVSESLAVDAARPDACVLFEGLAAAPFLISDIARTSDGELRLLVRKRAGPSVVAEWISTGSAAEIGRSFRPTGRTWPAPAHPQAPDWAYYVRDAGFLKDAARTIVEPEVVVAQISDGRTYDELTDVQLGRWYLYWWADPGAVLPPTFGGPANGCAFAGVQESADCSTVRGWAWDPMFPSSPVTVEILADGKLVGTQPADLLRPDIRRGDGRHGFAWPLSAALRDGKRHRITVRVQGAPELLRGGKQLITCR